MISFDNKIFIVMTAFDNDKILNLMITYDKKLLIR